MPAWYPTLDQARATGMVVLVAARRITPAQTRAGGKAVLIAALSSALCFTGNLQPSYTNASYMASSTDRTARASRSGVRSAIPVEVAADVAWALPGAAEMQTMANDVAAQIEAARVEAERVAAEAAAAAQATAEAAALEQAKLAQEAADTATKAAARAATPMPVSAVPATGSVKEYASSLVGGGEQFGCLDVLFQRESGWNPYADNPSSSAYGIPQALPGSKMASAGADWATNPMTQVRWGVGYINARYGTPCDALAASNAKGWY